MDAKLIYVQDRGLGYVEVGNRTYRVPGGAQAVAAPGKNELIRSSAGFLCVNPDGYTHVVTIGNQVHRFQRAFSTPYGVNAYGQSVSEVHGTLLAAEDGNRMTTTAEGVQIMGMYGQHDQDCEECAQLGQARAVAARAVDRIDRQLADMLPGQDGYTAARERMVELHAVYEQAGSDQFQHEDSAHVPAA